MARLRDPIDFRNLLSEGAEFQVDVDSIRDDICVSDDEDFPEDLKIIDEDTYNGDTAFKDLALTMVNLTDDGKIKKRILRAGKGEVPEDRATVKVHYNGFLDLKPMPFDSTLQRNRPLKVVLGNGQILPGLDFGIRTMKLEEKAQFLIHPDYAYTKNCFERVPGNAEVLFEVELLEIVNAGAAITFEELPEEKQCEYGEVYKYCVALNEKGKQYFKNHDMKKAIIEYNTAASKLERMPVPEEETQSRRELLLKLYSNLLLCLAIKGDAHKGCVNANKIYQLTKNGELAKIHPKIYYNHARCLRALGEYDSAKEYLEKALKMEPKNPELVKERLSLECDTAKYQEKNKKFAKAFIGNL